VSGWKIAQVRYEKNGLIRLPREALPPAFPIMRVDTIFYRLGLERG